MFSDMLAVGLCWALATTVRWYFDPTLPLHYYWSVWPAALALVGFFSFMRLYGGMKPPPAEELKMLWEGITIVFLVLAGVIFLSKWGDRYSRAVLLGAWMSALVVVPCMRWSCRILFGQYAWWGYPTVVVGTGTVTRQLIRHLRMNRGTGLHLVAALGNGDDPETQVDIEGIPILRALDDFQDLSRDLRISYAIVPVSDIGHERVGPLIDRYASHIPHILVIPQIGACSSLWATAKDVGGVLGLEVRRSLLLPLPRLIKAATDWALTLLVCLPSLPLMAAIALAIKLDSKGPVFYGHGRIRKPGKPFTAWKFRTMHWDADELLAQHLDSDPVARREWKQQHKLRNDPRITRVGRLLRRTSLDELPQIWNIIRGEMSLVGPRPVTEPESARYGDHFDLVTSVKPGLTGLWQISGRSDTSYDDRVFLDTYYVRNWSPWLDLYILAKTIRVTLTGSGAY